MTKKNFNILSESATLPFPTLRDDRWEVDRTGIYDNKKCKIKRLNKKTKEVFVVMHDSDDYGYWASYKNVGLDKVS